MKYVTEKKYGHDILIGRSISTDDGVALNVSIRDLDGTTVSAVTISLETARWLSSELFRMVAICDHELKSAALAHEPPKTGEP